MTAYLVLLTVAALTAFAIYGFMLRPMLKANPTLAPIFARLDAHEATIWGVVKAYVCGWKTILWARFLTISGSLGIVFGELLPDLQAFVQLPGLDQFLASRTIAGIGLGLSVIGMVTEKLRKATTGPVALPPADPVVVIPPSIVIPSDPVSTATQGV